MSTGICASSARLFAEARFATAVILLNGEIVDANQSTAELLGESAPSALWSRNLAEWIKQDLHPVIHSKDPVIREEYALRRSDGEIRTVLFSAWVLDPRQTTVPAKEIVIEDITERRQLELQLQQAQKMEALGRLAGGVAHDFNNLMTAIRGTCELILLRHNPDEALAGRIQVIARATEQGAQLTRQLLAFSRRQILQPTRVQVNQCLLELKKMLVHLIGEDIEVALHLSDQPLVTVIDGGQLQQVLLNIAVNARDAMPRGGTLVFRTSQCHVTEPNSSQYPGLTPGDYVHVSAEDSGCGMCAETVQHIFEPFFTTKWQGTGLGLSTAYGILKQSHGGIRVESDLGKGSIFHIYLPAAPAQEQTVLPAVQPALCRDSATVLIVEDEDIVRRGIAEFLELSGYRVLTAVDGVDGLEITNQNPHIALVITDIVMPRMRGTDMATELRRRRPTLPLLFMTGYTQVSVELSAFEGAAILHKPFALAEVTRRVQSLLGHNRIDRLKVEARS